MADAVAKRTPRKRRAWKVAFVVYLLQLACLIWTLFMPVKSKIWNIQGHSIKAEVWAKMMPLAYVPFLGVLLFEPLVYYNYYIYKNRVVRERIVPEVSNPIHLFTPFIEEKRIGLMNEDNEEAAAFSL